MPGMINKSLRLDEKTVTLINRECQEIGMSFNDYVLYAINVQLGLEDNHSLEILKLLAAWIKENHTPDNFPEDITLLTFHHIRDDHTLRSLYDHIVMGPENSKNTEALVSLHRRIGRMVKMVLNARVKARSMPLDPEEHLIKTYSLLEPDY